MNQPFKERISLELLKPYLEGPIQDQEYIYYKVKSGFEITYNGERILQIDDGEHILTERGLERGKTYLFDGAGIKIFKEFGLTQ